jgi:putative ABC transport system substrate-binding protein
LSRTQTSAAILLAVVLGALAGATPLAAAGRPVVVLTSSDAAPYTEALGGLQEFLAGQETEVALEIRSLKGDAAKAAEAVAELKGKAPALLVTLGSLATKAACDQVTQTPIVAGLVLNASEFHEVANVTGVALEFPVATELQWLQRFLPGHDRVGVLFNPGENGQKVERAAEVARDMGIELIAQPVNTPQDLPGALKGLARRIDVLWGMPDSVVFSRKTAKAILLFSFRNRIPLVGLSGAWVKAGALYSLERDYRDLGAQCGEMALQILAGEPVGSIPSALPRKVAYSLNQKTARHVKLKLSKDLVSGAKQVFE